MREWREIEGNGERKWRRSFGEKGRKGNKLKWERGRRGMGGKRSERCERLGEE